MNDEATAFLMERFYHHWLHDTAAPSKSEALRLAEADVRAAASDRAHPERRAWVDPEYWAAFQLFGAR